MNAKQVLLCLLTAGVMWLPGTATVAAQPSGSTGGVAASDKQQVTGVVRDANGPLAVSYTHLRAHETDS